MGRWKKERRQDGDKRDDDGCPGYELTRTLLAFGVQEIFYRP